MTLNFQIWLHIFTDSISKPQTRQIQKSHSKAAKSQTTKDEKDKTFKAARRKQYIIYRKTLMQTVRDSPSETGCQKTKQYLTRSALKKY